MNKYVGYLFRAVPYLIYKYPLINYYYYNKNKTSRLRRYFAMQNLIRGLLKRLKVEVIVNGLERLPTSPSYLLCPNHQSFMDALCLISVSDQLTSFVAKKESAKYVLVGKVISILEGKFLDRDNLRQEIKVMQSVKQSLREDNIKWAIYPEGTRSKDKDFKLNEFKPGAFKMAMSTGVDIYPVAMWGSFRILNPKHNKLKKQPVFISILPPLTQSDYENLSTVEVSAIVQSRIENEIENLKLLDKEYCLSHQK